MSDDEREASKLHVGKGAFAAWARTLEPINFGDVFMGMMTTREAVKS